MTANIANIKRGNNVRDNILKILTEEFPLTTKELFLQLKRDGSKPATYQAIHKAISQLLVQKMIIKEGKKYRISNEWINYVRDYIRVIEHTYEEKPNPKIILSKLGKNSLELHFKNYTNMCVFSAEILVEYRKKSSSPVENYALLRHGWFPLKFDFSHFQKFIELDDGNVNNHIIICKTSPFDKWINNMYRSTGTKDKFLCGLKLDPKEDLIVRGDLILEVHFSEKSKKKLDNIYQKITGLQDLFLYYTFGNDKEDFDITMYISKDPTKAKLIRDKVKAYFRK